MFHGLKKSLAKTQKTSTYRHDAVVQKAIDRVNQLNDLVRSLSKVWGTDMPNSYRNLQSLHTKLGDDLGRLQDFVAASSEPHEDYAPIQAAAVSAVDADKKFGVEFGTRVTNACEKDAEMSAAKAELQKMISWLQEKVKAVKSNIDLRTQSVKEIEYYESKIQSLENARHNNDASRDKYDRAHDKKQSHESACVRATDRIKLGLRKIESVLPEILLVWASVYNKQSWMIFGSPLGMVLGDDLLSIRTFDAAEIESVATARASSEKKDPSSEAHPSAAKDDAPSSEAHSSAAKDDAPSSEAPPSVPQTEASPSVVPQSEESTGYQAGSKYAIGGQGQTTDPQVGYAPPSTSPQPAGDVFYDATGKAPNDTASDHVAQTDPTNEEQ